MCNVVELYHRFKSFLQASAPISVRDPIITSSDSSSFRATNAGDHCPHLWCTYSIPSISFTLSPKFTSKAFLLSTITLSSACRNNLAKFAAQDPDREVRERSAPLRPAVGRAADCAWLPDTLPARERALGPLRSVDLRLQDAHRFRHPFQQVDLVSARCGSCGLLGECGKPLPEPLTPKNKSPSFSPPKFPSTAASTSSLAQSLRHSFGDRTMACQCLRQHRTLQNFLAAISSSPSSQLCSSDPLQIVDARAPLPSRVCRSTTSSSASPGPLLANNSFATSNS